MMTDKQLAHALLKTDFLTFVQRVFQEVSPGTPLMTNWHLEAICYVLELVANKTRRRQIIEVPPRSLKSICASVALPAWMLGLDPTRKIITVSYSQELATMHAAACRQVMKSAWYRELFPGTVISPGKDKESYYRTTVGGFRDATSVGGTLTGKGGDLIIIDDPAKPDEILSEVQRTSVNNWYNRTLLSRLNNKKTDGILLVMQRLHAEDLAGHVRLQEPWDALTIPAIATTDERVPTGFGKWHQRSKGNVIDPRREPREVLDGLKNAMGTYAFSAQYQQDPLPPDGSIVEWSWFKQYSVAPQRNRSHFVQSWDTASKNTEFADYSVCTTWAIIDYNYYLLDIYRAQLNFPQLRDAVIRQAEKWQPHEIWIEDAAAGMHLIPDLRLERPIGMPVPIPVTPEKDKVTRLHAVSAIVEQGRVFLPTQAPWLEPLRIELIQFPHGKHDDQVDSISQFLGRQESKRWNVQRAERRSMWAPPRKRK